MSANQEPFELNFYKWEKEFKDKPYLRQPIGEHGKNTHGVKLEIWPDD